MGAGTLPTIFKKQREIFKDQLEERFKVTGTPDKATLLALALAMDPSVDTTAESGIFADRSAAQELMSGEYRRGLLQRALKQPKQPSSSSSGGKRPMGELGTPVAMSSKKGPASILSQIKSKVKIETPEKDTDGGDHLLETVKAEEMKYSSYCPLVRSDTSTYEEHGMFDQSKFWGAHKQALPIHYSLWVAEVGCAKVASANIETVFSGAGRISNRSRKLSPALLSDYAFDHYNYKYDWLRPSLNEILKAYKKLYGKGAHESDAESNSSSGGEVSEGEEAGEEDEGGV